jgi:hypothetical protein
MSRRMKWWRWGAAAASITASVAEREMPLRKTWRWAVITALALSMSVGVSLEASPPAHADPTPTLDTILGNAPLVGTYVKEFELWYGLAGQLINGAPSGGGQLDQIKTLIQASQAQIIGQVDALATANVNSELDLAIEQLGGIDSMTPDQLAAYVTNAVKTVTDAKADLAAETDHAAQDRLGFDLNVIGPIALAASAKAGQTADIPTLTADLIQANQTLLTKLAPTCGLTPDSLDVHNDIENADSSNPIPGDLPDIPVSGRGACVSYKGPAPKPETNSSHITYFPASPHTAFLTWAITGQAQAEYTLGIFHSNDHINWPAAPDYSIAAGQAMADTSYPMAEAALRKLQNPANTPAPGSSVAMAASKDGIDTAFALDKQGVLYSSDNPTGHAPANWTPVTDFPGSLTPGSLASVAATTTADGRIALFALDRLGQIYYRWSDSSGASFSPWAHLDGHLNSIAVARNSNGALQIFGTDSTGAVLTRSQVMNADFVSAYAPATPVPGLDTWTGWETFSGLNLYKVVALAHSNGLIEVDGIAPGGGGLFHMRQTAVNSVHPSSGWTPWSEAFYGQGSLTDIAVSSNNWGEFSFYGVIDDTVRQNSEVSLDGYNTGGWFQLAGSGGIRNIAAYQFGGDTQLIGVKPDGTTVADVVSDGCVACDEGWGSPLTGATVRATLGFAPVLTSVTASAGKVTLTFTDESPNEDQFEVYQVAPNSAPENFVRDAGGLVTPNKTGVGENITFTDSTPSADPSQQCYRVFTLDWLGTFSAISDIMCSS